MKKSKRYNSTLGKAFFIIPILLIGTVIVYAFVQLNSPGTLMVSAETCPEGQATDCTQVIVSATVNGRSGNTPWSLSVTQGSYEVEFSSIDWYYTAPTHDVTVLAGKTAYAVGVYTPISRAVEVTATGFNVTSVVALHDVTPVIWINPSASAVTFSGEPFGAVSLGPGQSYNYTFSATGIYTYTIQSTSHELTVDVS